MHNADQAWFEIKHMSEDSIARPHYSDIFDFADSWQLRDDIKYIVRIFNTKTCKITEKSYKRLNSARKYIEKFADDMDTEVTFITDEMMHTNYSTDSFTDET